jgi:integrase
VLDGPYVHFDQYWQEALTAAGIKNFRFHDLRHTRASMLAAQGASLLEIADVLGHKTLAMVKRYSHLAQSHEIAAIERMVKAKGCRTSTMGLANRKLSEIQAGA